MQVIKEEKKNRPVWPNRLLILGGVALFVAIVILYSQMENWAELIDPKENYVIEVPVDDLETTHLSPSCYIAYYEKTTDDIDIVLLNENANEVEKQKCPEDMDAMSIKGDEYERGAQWKVSKDANYTLRVDCEEVSSETKNVWLVDYDKMEADVGTNPTMIATMLMCCLGICLVPLGVILKLIGPKPQSGQIAMIQTQAVTDAPVAFGEEGEQYVINSSKISDPENPEKTASLLTTDQIYALTNAPPDKKAEIIQQIDNQLSLNEEKTVASPFKHSVRNTLSTDESEENVEQEESTSAIIENKDETIIEKEQSLEKDEKSWSAWDDG